MYTHAHKTQKNKSQPVANRIFQHKSGGEATIKSVDNRAEAVSQRKLHEIAHNSPRTIQLEAFQEMADNSPQHKQAAQLQAMADHYSSRQQPPIQNKENNTGLPDNLKSGIENLSSYSMDDIKVHYNSDKPSQLQAHAYTQGADIYIAPGQEKHLPHEAWHVVQQKQGRVKPTKQLNDKVNINDDQSLEKEADFLGTKAARVGEKPMNRSIFQRKISSQAGSPSPIQRVVAAAYDDINKIDFLNLLAVDYALNYGGTPPVKLLANITSQELANERTLFVIAHGGEGYAGSYVAAVIGNRLDHLLEQEEDINLEEIKFLTCNAGTGGVASLVNIVAQKIQKAGITVSGTKGAGIYHSLALQDTVVVVKGGESGPEIEEAGLVQEGYLLRHGITDEYMERFMDSTAGMDLAEKAELATELTHNFVKSLVKRLADKKLILGRAVI